ncbi:MAG: aminoacetone oxidase family FAD-binding enzyme [Candidatus Gastranaerophilales bacterium]|nr:aminoacetone oxidase family FAD-binding enzyme [Candidatus Gastranaerophilales bacterium]
MTKVAIIGGGPSGVMAAISVKRFHPEYEVVIFEKYFPLKTLLPTGGGRCNLGFYETDMKSLIKNYPRGEKFLYSIFSQFSTEDTIEFFKSIGVKTYTQDDGRIFPVSDSSKEVAQALTLQLKKLKVTVKHSIIKEIKPQGEKFIINNTEFDKVIIAAGGRYNSPSSGFELAKSLCHKIIDPNPALSSLEIKEKYLSSVSGVSLKNVTARISFEDKKLNLTDDLLFTHKGISGPLAYKISSIYANGKFSKSNPVIVELDFSNGAEINLQQMLNDNSKKFILNITDKFMPKALAKVLLEQINLPFEKRCCDINKTEREQIKVILTAAKLTVTAALKDGEIVTAGGVDLNEINPKTLESKIMPNLYFCGEVLNIDGFCGGFNLQNCWSTGFIAGKNV